MVTSSTFACGIGWLVNSLIKMNIKGTSLLYKESNWLPSDSGKWRVDANCHTHMANHIPALSEQETFDFRNDVEFFWEHRIAAGADASCPVIVVLRDPRDAIFSLFRRWHANGWISGTFGEFLERPSDWPDHFPGLFYTNPITTYLLFHMTWLKAKQFRPVLFVRFEDFKTDPKKVLLDVFQFLRLAPPTEDQLNAAIVSSSFANAKKTVAKFTNPSEQMGIINKGQVFEWQQSYDPLCLRKFTTVEVDSVLSLLGYPCPMATHKQKFRNWVESPVLSAGYRLKTMLVEKLGYEKSMELAKKWIARSPRFRRRYANLPARLDYQMLMKSWAADWAAGGLPNQELEMQAFFTQLTHILLTPEERKFALTKTMEISNGWSSEFLLNQVSRFAKLNAL